MDRNRSPGLGLGTGRALLGFGVFWVKYISIYYIYVYISGLGLGQALLGLGVFLGQIYLYILYYISILFTFAHK